VLPAGKSTIRVGFKYDGGSMAKGGAVKMFVNDKQVADLWRQYVQSPTENKAFVQAMAEISEGVRPELARVIGSL
jgi:hypothetical protein